MQTYQIFVINPGSTSTKVALFQNEESVFSTNVAHAAKELEQFAEISEQLSYRKEIILREVAQAGVSLAGTAAFVGRGGGFQTMAGGTYRVNEKMLEDARLGIAGQHPSNLGAQLADELAREYGGGETFVVNGPTTDEFQDVARISGFADIYRESIIHALNQKEVGIRYAASRNRNYQDLNLVIAHIGGGISVTAHRRGRMVDSNDIINGDGPMAPTRSGSLPAASFLKQCFSGRFTERELYNRLSKSGGLVDHLGTADAREVARRIQNGDGYAKIVYDAMIYQIAKNIGAYATVLKGEVDAILLTGGIAHDDYVVAGIRDLAGYLAPVIAMPGEFELEALAAGALRVLTGQEEARLYTGIPVWNGFEK